MSVHLGAFISLDLTVDHKDEDCSNDDINNLQILTNLENIKKYKKYYQENIQKFHELKCPQCSSLFEISDRIYKARKKQAEKNGTSGNVFCHSDCMYLFYSENGISNGAKKSEKLIEEIKRLRSDGLTSYKISDLLKISRNTVMKYWK